MAFVLGKDRRVPQGVYLGTVAEVDDAVRAWRDEILGGSAGTGDDHREIGEKLKQLIWNPVDRHLAGADRVFVIPDGALNLVNLAALPSGQDRFLVETGPTLHLLSAERDLVAPEEFPPVGNGLLVLGAPAFGIPAEVPGEPTLSHQFQPLPATLQEIDEVQRLWSRAPESNSGSVVRLTGEGATELAFKTSSRRRQIIHLATHGFFLGGRDLPLSGEGRRGIGELSPAPPQSDPNSVSNLLSLSGLALTGANQRGAASGGDDGILTSEEIANLDLSGVEWAVLSACDTGLGEILPGEGVFGFRRAFRVAGARTVIMSLWPVEDESAWSWMAALYRGRFLERLDTATAIRQAILNSLEESRQSYPDPNPFFWAGFVASGDWR
jgi:CHAT domain-containing protein